MFFSNQAGGLGPQARTNDRFVANNRRDRARDARRGNQNALRNPYASMFGGDQMPFGYQQWGPLGGGQGRGFSGGGQYGNALMSYLPMLQQSLTMPAPSRRPNGPDRNPNREQQQEPTGHHPVRQIGNGPAVAIPHGDGTFTPHMPFWGSF